ncbi:hypothetical protein B0H11DRAFT_1912937 [Mycena galericulata]|nr:hypothetical protein B0H11DRAFT_1912937 [Mycena galericulata]
MRGACAEHTLREMCRGTSNQYRQKGTYGEHDAHLRTSQDWGARNRTAAEREVRRSNGMDADTGGSGAVKTKENCARLEGTRPHTQLPVDETNVSRGVLGADHQIREHVEPLARDIASICLRLPPAETSEGNAARAASVPRSVATREAKFPQPNRREKRLPHLDVYCERRDFVSWWRAEEHQTGHCGYPEDFEEEGGVEAARGQERVKHK